MIRLGIFITEFVPNFFVRHDRSKGVEILVKDLKVFASFNEELFKEITQLLTLENFRYFELDIKNINGNLELMFNIGFCHVEGKMNNYQNMETQNQLEL